MVSQDVRYGPWMPRLARRSCRVAVFALESKQGGYAVQPSEATPGEGQAQSSPAEEGLSQEAMFAPPRSLDCEGASLDCEGLHRQS